jgi:hypothetical protein
MDTVQLTQALLQDRYSKQCFGGVHPSNHLPQEIAKTPLCIIVNTDPSYKPGTHWLALYIDEKCKVEFFDSYGRTVDKYPFIKKFIERNNAQLIKANTHQLQGSLSSTCGQFCLYFLLWRCRGISFEKIMSSFSNSVDANDILVTAFVNSITGQNTSAYDVNYILNQCCKSFLPIHKFF